ncbi:MAG TPA: hypothetical protein VKY54_00225 [Kiloniellales bacterium]|jgi:hypothetical protein|nr:hypothetical protein [Kiloniellales bacterium]
MGRKSVTEGRRWKPGLVIGFILAAVVLLAVGANAHLVHLATTTQPECVPHLKSMNEADGAFRAAKSAC